MAKRPTNEELGRQTQELERDALKSRIWQENTGEFSAAAEQSFDGIMTSDMEKNVTYVNQAYAAMHGYSADEMIGMKVEAFHDLRTKKHTLGVPFCSCPPTRTRSLQLQFRLYDIFCRKLSTTFSSPTGSKSK